jgi:hypothetical protein
VRAVSLSNTQVISLLNRYFVPVYVSNEDYRDGGRAAPEEKAELHRIHQEGYAAKLSVGTVHAYVLTADGHTIDSLHTAQAARSELLVAMLERNVQKLGTPPGEPLVKPCPPPSPAPTPGELLLHLTARYLERKGDEFVLVENAGGNWSALPGEDWIRLARGQCTKILPTGPVKVGDSWELDRQVASEILLRCYPPTEDNDLAKIRIERQSLRATVVSSQKGIVRAQLEGSLRMKKPFYHKEDANFAEASFVGFLEFEPERGRIRSLRMVTDGATYGDEKRRLPYGVAVRSIP